MARDSSGTYSLPAGINPVVTLTTITSNWWNTTGADIGAEITNSLDRQGRGAMLASLQLFNGTILSPGLNWASEPTSGLYRAGAGDFRFVVSSTLAGALTAAGLAQIDGSGSTFRAGFRDIPQNSRSADYTLVASDAGKHVYHPTADATPRTFTIPANASVAFPLGTAITFINDTGAGAVTIAITSDTLVQAGTGSTGSRTLTASGVATAVKMGTTRWMISGTGLS